MPRMTMPEGPLSTPQAGRLPRAADSRAMADDPDFAAEGLLDGLEGDARAARERLLQRLHADGVGIGDLRRAAEEDRLVLVPVERALRGEAKYTGEEVAE